MADGFLERCCLPALMAVGVGKSAVREPDLDLEDVLPDHPSVGHPVHLVPDRDRAVAAEVAGAEPLADAAAAQRKPDVVPSAA
jgi:hypothetical protein